MAFRLEMVISIISIHKRISTDLSFYVTIKCVLGEKSSVKLSSQQLIVEKGNFAKH